MDRDYKNLVDVDKWEDIFQSNDENKLNDEVENLKYAMAELKSLVYSSLI